MIRKLLFPALLAVLSLCPSAARAQFIGYTSPQTVSVQAFTNTACTGSNQSVTVPNLGQTVHFFTYSVSSVLSSITAEIDASGTGGGFQRISDVGTSLNPLNAGGIITANGYYPVIQVTVVCPAGSTVSGTYLGSNSNSVPQTGVQQMASYKKVLVANSNANTGTTLGTPFGNTCGQIVFAYSSAVAGTTIAITASEVGAGTVITLLPAITVQNNTLQQVFTVPCQAASTITVTVLIGGASSYSLAYLFSLPGSAIPTGTYTHVTTTTATAAKTVQGFLHTVTINTGGAGTLSIFDLPGASCTGTPATNTVAVITSVAATLQTFVYDTNFLQGICLKSSAAMDYTVSSQ